MIEEREGSEYAHYGFFSVEYRDASHRYWLLDDKQRFGVPGVTTALGVLDKPALLAWAERAGIEGALVLERMGELRRFEPHESGEVQNLFRLHNLGKDAKRDKGADRGTSIHSALELWARDGYVPDVADFPPENRGFVAGLCAWLLRDRPTVLSAERIVGSWEHEYAGRMDLRAEIGGRDVIVDLKTSRTARVYEQAHLQARAYAMADVECGQPEPDGIIIVAVGEDGSFETDECQARPEDWLSVLRCHRAVSNLRKARARRAREAA